MKHRKSADRARRFCSALATETRDRPNWCVAIQTVADRLGMLGDDAIELADDCARAGLAMHDQSQHTATERRAAGAAAQRHAEAGRARSGEGEGAMSDGMPVEQGPAEMFVLRDCATVRLQLPPLPMAGRAEPLRVHLDFNAESVDEIIAHLVRLRAQMLPAPARN